MNKEQINGLLRHAISGLGGWLITGGLHTQVPAIPAEVSIALGTLAAYAASHWSVASKSLDTTK